MTKEEILAEIKRTAEENDRKPLGITRFVQQTGIKSYDWQKYWPRFGDAQLEAGFEPNAMNPALTESYLLEKTIELIRELNKFPTSNELKFKSFNSRRFPNPKTFHNRFGGKSNFILKVSDYIKDKPEFSDVLRIIEVTHVKNSSPPPEKNKDQLRSGYVYLFRERPGHYKIGISEDPERRLYELTKGPYKPILVHKIQTDDPFGIELYWHKRFENKLMRGEWFRLNSADEKAFKRWKRIF